MPIYACADNSDRAFYKELVKVVEASDVILEVLDSRDPLGTRCMDMEKMVMKSGPDKRLVLLLNKIGNFFSPFLSSPHVRIFFLWRRSGEPTIKSLADKWVEPLL